MRGHALDVFHQSDRVLEDVVIDALQDEGHRRALLLKDGAIGVVDVAVAVGFSALEFAADLKLACRGCDIRFCAHDHSLSG